MINNQSKWYIKVTHTPTGIYAIRSSKFFRSQHYARKSAIKYIQSRLYMLNYEPETQSENIDYEYSLCEDSN